MNHKLSEKWIKASIIGTIWAASEIVLGSFLHNLKIPFSGNILTAIGLIILISISYIWTEKGLFWRAGLICAIMKTMSPSAVIFGPMIAIFSESLLLEFSVRLLGRNIPGYAIGSMLAMSWNLFQKIGNYIIYYGSNIIEVYSNLLKLAQKQLNIQTDIVWLPIIILFIVYALFGLFAAVIGIRVGRKMLKQPPAGNNDIRSGSFIQKKQKENIPFNYSVAWLFLNIIMVICSFLILAKTSWLVWSISITVITVLWTLRYRRALRQLSKPRFWIFFVLITLATAVAFTKAMPGENFWQQGLLTGIQMNFRAIVIIVGFSAIGAELYNPAIRNYFLRTSFKNLPLAVELSVESLPDFIATIPDFKSLIKNPVANFYQVLSHADERLNEIRKKNRQVFIVSGAKAEGKTTFVKKTIDFLKKKNIKVSGILAERIMTGSSTTGYDLFNIETGERKGFLNQNEDAGNQKIGKFIIRQEGLAMGKDILNSLISSASGIIIIDEIGMLELRGEGWAENLSALLEKSGNNILLVVRDEFVDQVISKWRLTDAVTLNIGKTEPAEVSSIIEKKIR